MFGNSYISYICLKNLEFLVSDGWKSLDAEDFFDRLLEIRGMESRQRDFQDCEITIFSKLTHPDWTYRKIRVMKRPRLTQVKLKRRLGDSVPFDYDL
jgi:hypothetical protein